MMTQYTMFDIFYAKWIDGKPKDVKRYSAVQASSWQEARAKVRERRAAQNVKDERSYWYWRPVVDA
jgi:hypothetical protein